MQATLCPLAVQPAGMVPSARLVDSTSRTVACAVVAVVPVLVTVKT